MNATESTGIEWLADEARRVATAALSQGGVRSATATLEMVLDGQRFCATVRLDAGEQCEQVQHFPE